MADIPVRVIIDAIDSASAKIKNIGMSMDDLSSNLTKVGAVGAAVGGITALVTKGFIEQAGAMEQNKIAFTTMLGSQEKAIQLLDEMSQFAARTPFNLPDIVNAGKQLLAYGFAQKDVIATTEMLGNVAAGLNIPIGDIIYLFGTLRAQGRAYTKDINQFTARGIPILDQLAKQYGVTTKEVFKFVEEGKVGFEDVEKAFESMTGKSGLFFNLMDKQSKSTLGTWSNFQDSITRLQVTMGEALLPTVVELLQGLIPLVAKVGEWAKANPEIVKGMVAAGLAIGAIGVVLITIGAVIPPIIAAVTLLSAAFTTIGAVVGAAAAILAAFFTPVLLVIAAVAAAIAFLAIAWNNNWMDIQGKTQAVINYIGNIFQGGLLVVLTEKIPFAIGFLVGRFVRFATVEVPSIIRTVLEWFGQLPTTISSFLSALPGVISNWFNQAKERAINIARDLYSGVAEWFNKVINLFGDIINKAGEAISKAREAVTAGFNVGKRQFGGPVNSLQPVMVGEAGPEMFIPQTAGHIKPAHESSRGGSGVNIQFIINSPMIINSPTERMSIAEALYKDLVKLARSQNQSVAEMLGG